MSHQPKVLGEGGGGCLRVVEWFDILIFISCSISLRPFVGLKADGGERPLGEGPGGDPKGFINQMLCYPGRNKSYRVIRKGSGGGKTT